MDTRTSAVRLRLDRLREELAHEGVQALLVPSSDPHLSEYLPGHWQGREWFSGFTGSMGTLVVTPQEAVLFADSRYWEQAERELQGSGVTLERIPTGNSTAHVEWLADHVQPGRSVAVDGQVLGLGAAQQLRAALERRNIVLRSDTDLLARVWPERPALPAEPVWEHRPPHATVTRVAKLGLMREAMQRHGATHHFVSTLDDIAWMLNLRGSDVSYNPVFLAHLLVDAGTATLFIGSGKIDSALRETLAADGIALAAYEQAAAALRALPAGATVLLDPKRVTFGLRQAVPGSVRVVEAINPSTLAKSRKTETEAGHIREAMAEDGAAMCEFYAGFEASMARGEPWDELKVDARLSAARARRSGFVGLSFSTIAGFNANGAMPHYRATPESFARIEGNGLLLIDSGGQYLGGTTDITRVWPIGSIGADVRRDCTRVLQGMMALSRTRFPRGTASTALDAIARVPLWAEGLDYGHGTGHGVGYFLAVHEGPQSIGRAAATPEMALEPGMVTSIEPGLYRPGRWGVRIENLVLNVPAPTPEGSTFGEFLSFETLTLCPIDTRCLDRELMRADEIAWLDAYHATVRERLAPRLAGLALGWLLERTQPLSR